MLEPPPEMVGDSMEELEKRLKQHAISQGYLVSKRDSRKNGYVIWKCVKGGRPKSANSHQQLDTSDGGDKSIAKRRRSRGSEKTGCPFSVMILRHNRREPNNCKWRLQVKNPRHNHAPEPDAAGHPSAREFSLSDEEQVQENLSEGKSSKESLSQLLVRKPLSRLTLKDVENLRSKLKARMLATRNSMSFFTENVLLRTNAENADKIWEYNAIADEDDKLDRIVVVHKSSLRLAWASSFSRTLGIDTTYKTNKNDMKMIYFLSVPAEEAADVEETYVGFAFLRSLGTEEISWALEEFKHLAGLVLSNDVSGDSAQDLRGSSASSSVSDRASVEPLDGDAEVSNRLVSSTSSRSLSIEFCPSTIILATDHVRELIGMCSQLFSTAYCFISRAFVDKRVKGQVCQMVPQNGKMVYIGWLYVANSANEEEYAARRQDLIAQLDPSVGGFIEQWLTFRQHFVNAWVQPWSEAKTDFKIEKIHGSLKTAVGSSICDITLTVLRLADFLDEQIDIGRHLMMRPLTTAAITGVAASSAATAEMLSTRPIAASGQARTLKFRMDKLVDTLNLAY